MKFLLFSTLFLTLSLNSFSQKPVTFNENIRYGVYLSFAEFQNNSPSITGDFKPSYRLDFYNLPPVHIKIKTPQGKYEILDKPAWGYSDSSGVYVYHKTGFNKIDQFGRYCAFEGLKRIVSDNPFTNASINYSDVKIKMQDYFFDVYTGEIRVASKASVEEILKDDPELYKEFSDHGKKSDVYIYIERYNKKHTITYPIKVSH